MNNPLAEASRLMQQGRLEDSIRLCTDVIRVQPASVTAFHLRGLCRLQMNQLGPAIRDLSIAVERQAENGHAALFLGRALRMDDQIDRAIPVLESALKTRALEVDARYELARCLVRCRRQRDAILHYESLLAIRPDHADAAANLAFLLERDNRLDEAASRAHQSLEQAPENTIALLALATVERRQGKPERAITRLDGLISQDIQPLNRSIALQQKAQCLEQMSDHPSAIDAWQAANQTLLRHHPHASPDPNGSYGMATVDRILQWLKAHPAENWSADPPDEHEPVFLVGFPRSGTTLLDRALSAHPDIEVLEEIELLQQVRETWVENGALDRLDQLGPDELRKARTLYLDARNEHRGDPGAGTVIDKLPLNLVYLFLIRRLFPRARILFMVRDPRDVVLSCFVQAFELTGPMPYFLEWESTARYYDQVMTLTTGHARGLDLNVHRCRYEDLVSSFELQLRGIVGFLGLNWDDAVLNYRRNARQRQIDTPSYQQVSRPLYTTSVGRWQNYARSMEPILPVLGPWVEHFGYAAKNSDPRSSQD